MQKLITLMAAVLALAIARSPAQAIQSIDLPAGSNVEIQSSFDQSVAFSTAKQANRENFGRLSTDHNTLNFFASRVESLITVGLGTQISALLGVDSIRLFYHPRFYADTAFGLDHFLNNINNFTSDSRYRGSGFAVSSTSSDAYEYDTNELYFDIRKGPLWIRAGKQVIEYGGGILTRATNEIDSLDLRRNLFIDNLLTEWKDQEIGQWTVKASYDLDLSRVTREYVGASNLTAWISPDTQPSIFPAPGNALGVLPSFTRLQDADQIARAHHRLSWGAAAMINTFGLDITALYFSTPQHLGQFFADTCRGPAAGVKDPANPFAGLTTPGCIPGTPFRFDPDKGFPLFAGLSAPDPSQFNPKILPAVRQARLNPAQARANVLSTFGPNFGTPQFAAAFVTNAPLQFVFNRHFPRENVYALLFSYAVVQDYDFPGAFLLNGDQLRFDLDYKPQKKFTAASGNFRGFAIGNLDATVEIERFVRFIPQQPQATFLIFEYIYSSAADLFDDSLRQEGLSGGEHLWAFAAQQNWLNSRLTTTNVFSTDSAGFGAPGFLDQIIVQYKPRSYLEYRVAYDYFTGSSSNLLGRVSQDDEVILGVTLKF